MTAVVTRGTQQAFLLGRLWASTDADFERELNSAARIRDPFAYEPDVERAVFNATVEHVPELRIAVRPDTAAQPGCLDEQPAEKALDDALAIMSGQRHGDDHDQSDHGNWARVSASVEQVEPQQGGGALPAPGTARPPKVGAVPVPEGMVRVFHYIGSNMAHSDTTAMLTAILKEGLRTEHAQGHTYGEPDQVWASFTRPDSGLTYVEIAVRPDEVDIGGPSPGVTYPQGRTWAEQAAAVGSNITLKGDVPPERILTYSEPWMRHYDYLQEDPAAKASVIAGEFDGPMFQGSDYGPAIALIKREAAGGEKALGDALAIMVGLAEWDESLHPRDEAGKFTSSGGGSSVPDPREAGGFERLAALGANKPYRGAVRVDIGPGRTPESYAAIEQRTREQMARWPVDVLARVAQVEVVDLGGRGNGNTQTPPIFGDLTVSIDRDSYYPLDGKVEADHVIAHEMAHVLVATRSAERGFNADRVDRADWVQRMVEGPDGIGARGEILTVSPYAYNNPSQEEAFAEAVALYVTSGRVPGPETAKMLRRIGLIGGK